MSLLGDALVLFSGGQDSTVCLAWALERFARVETIGFDYGQRHAVELDVRPRIRERLSQFSAAWRERLGEDHVVRIDALAAISETALTRDVAIEISELRPADDIRARPQSGIFLLCRRARLSARHKAPRCRHVRDRLFRLSRLPRRHHQGDAACAHARHGPPLRHPHSADVDRQGGDLCIGRRRSAARP